MSHQGHLKSVPSLVERTSMEANHKTTPLHMQLFEDGDKYSGDCRDSLTEDNIELVNNKLQEIAASREKDDSDLSTLFGLKIQVSEADVKEPTDILPKEEIGNILK